MGLEYSCFELINNALSTKITKPDGSIHERSPIISGIVVGGAIIMLITIIDGGNGMISKTFGYQCVKCIKQ